MVKYRAEELFMALGTPARRHMVEQLARHRSLTISQLAEPLNISLPAALKHTKILESSGLITRRKEGREQQCALNPHALTKLADWLTSQQLFWEGSFARLERHINNKRT